MGSSEASTVKHSARVPLLALAFQTGEAANGGIESFSLIASHLERHEVRIVTQLHTARVEAWRKAGHQVDVIDVPLAARDWTLAARLDAFRGRIPAFARGQLHVGRLVRGSGAKVVHFNDQDAFYFGALGARAAGARLVVSLRGTTGTDRWRWFAIATLADVVVCLSNDMVRRFERHLDARDPQRRLPRAELVAVPSIVPLPASASDTGEPKAEIRRRLGLSERGIVIASVGATVPLKRQLDVLRAFAPRLERLGAELVFVGDFDPKKSAYAAECARAHREGPSAERVRFAGYTRDVASWYRAADLVVIGSDHEGLARAMLEALSHGVPVVSTDVCSAHEVLDASGAGRVVPVGRFDELADAVEKLLSGPISLEELGARGRAFVAERYDAPSVAARYDDLFDDLARRRR